MAVQMTVDLATFIKRAYGINDLPTDLYPTGLESALKEGESLVKAGWKFTSGILTLTAISPAGQKFNMGLPTLYGEIMAGKSKDTELLVLRSRFTKFTSELLSVMEGAITGGLDAAELAKAAPKVIDVAELAKAALQGSMGPSMKEKAAALAAKKEKMEGAQAGGGAASVMPLGPLSKATELGQKVTGTSSTNLYTVVAVGALLNVAARTLDKKGVSIRVEGPGLNSPGVPGVLKAMGLSVFPSHASIHLATSDELPAHRIIGSIVMGIGVDFNKMEKPSVLSTSL